MARVKNLPPLRVNLDNPSVISILEAAELRFALGGFHATSMREIASAAGVSKALIHYHFDSKESLFLEMLGWLYRTVAADIERLALHEASPGLEAADRALQALTAAMHRLAPLMPVFAEVGVVALQASALRQRTEILLDETRALVEVAIHRILDPDQLAALPVTPARLAALVHSALHGIALSALYDEDSLDAQMDTLRAFLFAAIGARPPEPRAPDAARQHPDGVVPDTRDTRRTP